MKDPYIALIVAASENNVIGKDNTLPWHLPADLKHFKKLTMGKPLIMGRKTFQSIGCALPGRLNLVVSRGLTEFEGATRCSSLEEALEVAKQAALETGAEEIMIIGGARVYEQALPIARRLYLTRVHLHTDGDTLLPEIPSSEWTEIEVVEHLPQGEVPGYSFIEMHRNGL
ncbi:MAG: dihydrofolate reductase [Pseudomonadota bacterium]